MACKHGNHAMHCGWCEDQADLVAAREYAARLLAALRDEMDENLRLRELGGALPDENITAMTERVIAEREKLRAALLGLMQIHTEPAGYPGKFGKELDRFLDEQTAKIEARVAAAKAALGLGA